MCNSEFGTSDSEAAHACALLCVCLCVSVCLCCALDRHLKFKHINTSDSSTAVRAARSCVRFVRKRKSGARAHATPSQRAMHVRALAHKIQARELRFDSD